ncbi:GIDA-domain-containing protein [Armillaria solidipes]|uniref:GIDA-domain-containing protein n=1 Tax=Armillaria solidipes TaxID=1076256 RepID=A0A2H3BRK8_9AGAR|nr:GIDA-domain-containing protein [Armillaria solidipes]
MFPSPTKNLENIGELSCNPSIGGVGKGTLVREVDTMDGLMGRVADMSGIMFRMLNATKGSAVWGTRAQIDRKLYKHHMKKEFAKYEGNLHIRAADVFDLVFDHNHNLESVWGRIKGVSQDRFAPRLKLGRLQTGTPARLDGKIINFTTLGRQDGDEVPAPFSFLNDAVPNAGNQVPCCMTTTNPSTHQIVRDNMHRSVNIQETKKGPRHCPSLEAKILRFDRDAHIVWLDPEGYDSGFLTPSRRDISQWISCSLPEEVQEPMLRTIKGLENVKIVRPAYGVEYDYVDPRELLRPLPRRTDQRYIIKAATISRLLIPSSGTTGYEEAAAQGIVAGINAGLAAQKRPPFVLTRAEGFIGVLIDDLIVKGADEPYRMLTSRSEYRMTLRPENSNMRLTAKGLEVSWICSAFDLLRYQTISSAEFVKDIPLLANTDPRLFARIDTEDEGLLLNPMMDYLTVEGLSSEIRERLFKGAAKRMEGMTPSSMVHLLRHAKRTFRRDQERRRFDDVEDMDARSMTFLNGKSFLLLLTRHAPQTTAYP